jgi:hypothetical protein
MKRESKEKDEHRDTEDTEEYREELKISMERANQKRKTRLWH